MFHKTTRVPPTVLTTAWGGGHPTTSFPPNPARSNRRHNFISFRLHLIHGSNEDGMPRQGEYSRVVSPPPSNLLMINYCKVSRYTGSLATRSPRLTRNLRRHTCHTATAHFQSCYISLVGEAMFVPHPENTVTIPGPCMACHGMPWHAMWHAMACIGACRKFVDGANHRKDPDPLTIALPTKPATLIRRP